MKRRYFAILLMAALLVSCFAVSALATQAQLNYVTDEAGLFTDTERGTLESRAQEISERYNFGVYIITLPDYRDYTTSSSVETCAMELYDDNTLGWGSDRAGTMLLLSMQERDFDLDFYSSRANRIFTEVGRDRMEDRFIPYFRNDNFYGGYMEYLNTCEEYLQAAEEGHPVGEGESRYSGQDEKASPALALIPGGAFSPVFFKLLITLSLSFSEIVFTDSLIYAYLFIFLTVLYSALFTCVLIINT